MRTDYITHHRQGLVQVSKEHYFTAEYLSQARFLGLHAQLNACLEAGKDKTFLEIGPGPGLLYALLCHFGCKVTTVDFASDLKPAVVGQLPQLPFGDHTFDIVCAFEVLEHMPFELLGECLREMRRIATKRIILTVPDQQELQDELLSIQVRIGKRQYHKVFIKGSERLTNPDQHYWEVGFQGISDQKVQDIGRSEDLLPVSTYFVSPWFRFFIFDVE
jgi:ubiquinone/menaquinone biosynthesis C-methylase UbiE